MSKLHCHYQRTDMPWVCNLATSWAKVVNPPEVNPFPASTKVIGRFYMPEAEEERFILGGAEGAAAYFYHWREAYEARPYLHAVEWTNEFIPNTVERARKLAQFTAEGAKIMHVHDLNIVGLNLSVGWPMDRETAQCLLPAVDACDYIGLHEYAAPRMQDGGGHWTLRYRKFYEACPDARILITECGIDGGCISEPRRGWKDYCSEDAYWQQLQWYDSELAKDDYVKAAFIFTAGPESDWKRFEVTENLARRIWQGHHFEQRLAEVAQVHIIPQNPDAAFYRYGRERGWEPISGEFDFEGHRAQVWYDANEERQKVMYARIGDWANIKVIDRAN